MPGSAEVVHPVPVDDVAGWATTLATTFLDDVAGDDHQRDIDALRRSWDGRRRWGARSERRHHPR